MKFFLVLIVVVMASYTDANCCANKALNSPGARTDLARGATVTMSSEYGSGQYSGSKVVDGIYVPSPETSSIAHTLKETSPWIMIDLGQTRCVKGVKIWNRSAAGYGVMSRFTSPLISVAAAPNGQWSWMTTQCHYNLAPYAFSVKYYQCGSVKCGRYVRVYKYQMNNYLNLYEIEVHGW